MLLELFQRLLNESIRIRKSLKDKIRKRFSPQDFRPGDIVIISNSNGETGLVLCKPYSVYYNYGDRYYDGSDEPYHVVRILFTDGHDDIRNIWSIKHYEEL